MSINTSRFTDILSLLLSGVLYAIALQYFVFPSRVILTGTEGIAASLSYYFDSKTLFLICYGIFHSALIAFAWFKLSQDFAKRTLIVIVIVAIGLALLPNMQFASPEPQNERILLVFFGGLLAGVAKALAFRAQGSAGDEDIIGAYIASKYLRPVGSVAIFSAVVSTVVGLALSFAKTGQFEDVINTLMYTCIYIFVSAETLNTLYRKFRLTLFTVVTQKPDRVGQGIRSSLPHRTYTVQDGVGGHSDKPFKMVRTIITHEELPALIEIMANMDEDAFYYYHDVEGVSNAYYITPIGQPRRT